MPILRYGKPRNPKGRDSTWNYGKTRTIRVPVAIADEVLAYARELDSKKGMQTLTQSLERRFTS